MASNNEEYQRIFYQVCDGEKNLGSIQRVKLAYDDLIRSDVADLVDLIREQEQLPCRPRDLCIYARGTAMENYKTEQPLKISTSLNDSKIQGTSEDDPLLVVLSAPTPSFPTANNTIDLVNDDELQQGLRLMAQNALARNATISISNATTEKMTSLLEMMGLSLKGATWKSKPPLKPVCGFDWPEGDEDSDGSRREYMRYLQATLQVPQNYALADVQQQRSLLNLDGDHCIANGFRLRGTTDVVIAKSEHVENKAIKNNIEALLELKKQTQISKKDHTPQTICEHFAASYLNPKLPVVSVLTDLSENWTFFWFAFDDDDTDDDPDLVLYKLCLGGKKAAANAKYLLDSLFDTTVDNNLPNTFAKRQPFRAIHDFLTRRKKRRREFDGDYSNSEDRNSKPPPRGADRSPVNDPSADPSATSGRPSENNEGGNCSGRERSMSMADSLSLFAPPASRDVGNELDLLDMVDESEQYEIVRSFAAKHIVPYMYSSSEA
ncbi:unnamed protein product [Cylindrotheca closterium]|uniref:Uncharacterized protein n=1 Tax=Cylindrotheca closterium TaxID=2856 RepID=A0AAD2FWF6_9STRA|nr:unnamed protein product [Cylindrotheca closterium]